MSGVKLILVQLSKLLLVRKQDLVKIYDLKNDVSVWWVVENQINNISLKTIQWI